MLKRNPIGFFDSGYGGLTILREVQRLLPQYDYLYFGDNQRAPYGNLSSELVYQYTWEGILALFEKGCDLIILACNTASAKALRRIQQNDLLSFPEKRVLGVIRPSAEIVGSFSKTNHIVILGTKGTISSNTYIDEFKEYSPNTIVNQYACPEWVTLIESLNYKTEAGKSIINTDIKKIISTYPLADVILLGCTHYPILQQNIVKQVPQNVRVVSQGELVANSLSDYLKRHPEIESKLEKNNKTEFYTSGNPNSFREHASSIIGMEISEVKHLKI